MIFTCENCWKCPINWSCSGAGAQFYKRPPRRMRPWWTRLLKWRPE